MWVIVAAVGVAVLVVGGIFVVRAVTSSSAAAQPECTVPAVAGAPVTVVVEGPQASGAGAAGTAESNASPTAATEVTTAGEVTLDAVQLQHASTINAVGLRRALPERARIIAVATAWQESKLRNLAAGSGDRDSVGLFQQRPSQGWGTAAELADPVFAAGAFYDALLKVQDWPKMSLTKAAQSVQFSAFPDAYAQWEPNATTLVRSLSGGGTPTLSCRAGAQASTAAAPTRQPLAGTTTATPGLVTLLAAAEAELGGLKVTSISPGGLGATVTAGLKSADPKTSANALAAWLVAHTTGYGTSTVQVGVALWSDHGWSAATGQALAAGRVTVSVAGA